MSKHLGIGLMSGTSLDGVDAVLTEIENTEVNTDVKVLNSFSVSYTDEEKQRIMALCDENTAKVDEITAMNFYLGEKFSYVVMELINQSKYSVSDIDFVSSHGQTIYHRPEEGHTEFEPKSTLQIGDISVISERTGLPVVGDFRTADMAAGGQGAPLVSFIDYMLFKDDKKARALQNIGGIGNVTYIKAGAKEEELLSFDTGPGNMVIDEVVYRVTKGSQTFDKGGEIALSGSVNKEFANELLRHEYFLRKPPKTTGREIFGKSYVDSVMKIAKNYNLLDKDLIASITYWTAKTISDSYQNFILAEGQSIDEVIIAGGGSHNKAILNFLQEELRDQRVMTFDDFGISSDMKEAVAFVVLGYHFLKGKYNTIPSATNSERKAIMGKVSYTQPSAYEKVLSIRGR